MELHLKKLVNLGYSIKQIYVISDPIKIFTVSHFNM